MAPAASTRRPRRQTRLVRPIGFLVSIGALLLIAVTFDVGDALVVLRDASPGHLVLVLAVVALQVVVRAARWRQVLPRRADGRRPSLGASVGALLIGYLASGLLPARLGEPIRAIIVARSQRLPVGGAFGAVVLERVVDLATLSIVGLGAAILIDAPGWISNLAMVVALFAVIVLGMLITVGLDPALAVALRVSNRAPSRARAAMNGMLGRARSFADGISAHRRRPDVAVAAILSGVGWLLDAVIIGLVAAAIGLPISPGEAIVISAVGALATAVPSAPGYLGTFELAVTAAAVALGATGASGLALAIGTHAIVLGPVLVAGVMVLARTGLTLGGLARSAATEPSLDRSPAA